MKLQFHFESKPWSDEVSIYLVGRDAHNKRFIGQPVELVFKEHKIGESSEPTLRFHGEIAREFFPALVQGLAESGYKYESSDAGELKVSKENLKDLRELAHNMGILLKEKL